MDAPPALEDDGPIGCVVAIAIGVLTMVLVNGAIYLLTDLSLNLAEEWFTFPIQVAIISAPFVLLAGLGIRNKLPWIVGLLLTFALWGYYLFDVVSYRWYPDGSGARIFLGLIFLFSPVPITGLCLATWALQRRTGPSQD